MASPTWWTWVWTSSRSWWWTEKPGMLWSMRSQSQTQWRDWTQLTASLIFHWASFEISAYNTIQLRVHDNQIEEHFLKSQYAYNTEAPFDGNWVLRPLGSRFGLCSPTKHFPRTESILGKAKEMNAAHCWESDHTAMSDGRGWPQQEPWRTTASLERSYHREGGIWPSDPDWRSSFRNGPTVDTRIFLT